MWAAFKFICGIVIFVITPLHRRQMIRRSFVVFNQSINQLIPSQTTQDNVNANCMTEALSWMDEARARAMIAACEIGT